MQTIDTMKKINTWITLLFILSAASNLWGQDECAVKKLGIEMSYDGDCNKGLAHG